MIHHEAFFNFSFEVKKFNINWPLHFQTFQIINAILNFLKS